MTAYKLPICWLNQKTVLVHITDLLDPSREEPIETPPKEIVIGVDMVNADCHCHTPMAAMFCGEGHMTECHTGSSCEEANCSHYQSSFDDSGII